MYQHDWVDNPYGIEPPEWDACTCDHGKLMTEPCEECQAPESMVTEVLPVLREQQVRR